MFKFVGRKKQAELQALLCGQLELAVQSIRGNGAERIVQRGRHDCLLGEMVRAMGSWPYAPCLTDDVQRLCWSRGYKSITHGGGAFMILHTNDTDDHEPARKRFIDLQTQRMLGDVPALLVHQPESG